MKYAFKDIASNCTEKRIPTEEDRLTYIGLEHLDSRKLAITRYGSDVPLKGEKLVMKKGDILFGKRNTYLKRVAIAPFDGLFSAHGMVLRPNEKVISKEFFPFFLSSDYFLDEAIRISVGSLSPTVNWKDLRDVVFEIPDFEKQHELALFLSSANELKESYEKMIAATDEMVKSQFIEMFGKTKQVSIGSLFDTTSGGTPSRTKNSYYDGGDIPWLTSSEVGQGLIKKTESFITEDGLKNSSAKWVPKYSVVVAMYGATVGKVGLLEIPCTTNQAVCSILPNANVIPMFLLYAVKDKEEWMISQAAGAAQPNISQAVIRKMEIPIPPKEEQIAFVEIAEQADKSKFELKQAIEKIGKVMRALMQ
jgi:type I restriction enzyme S subunit